MPGGARKAGGGAIVTAAAIAAGCGLVAVVTGQAPIAAVGGIACVVTAVLAIREHAAAAESAPKPATGRRPSRPAPDVDLTDTAVGPSTRRRGGAPPPEAPAAEVATVRDPRGPSNREMVDDSGLLRDEFLLEMLRGRVAAARRALRPLSLVCFETVAVDDDLAEQPVPANAVAEVLRGTLRESDVVGRTGDGVFLFVLEDTTEDGAVWTAERLRRNLAATDETRRFRAGVASYPSHGLESDELRSKAAGALQTARDWSRDRIEVATA